MSRAPDAPLGREYCCQPGPGPLGVALCSSAAHDGQRYNAQQHSAVSNTGPWTGMHSSPAFNDRFEEPAQRGGAANALPHNQHYDADDIDASNAFVATLALKDDDEILASLLGEDHGVDFKRSGPPIALGPQLHRDFAFVSGPVASMLEHGGNGGDNGGDMSTSSKAPDFSWIMEAAVRSVHSQAAQPASVESPVTAPGDTMVLPMRKRMREALSEKKRRVPTETQPGSPAAFRAPMGAIDTAATQTTFHIDTAAATAPSPENQGAAVVEPTARVSNGFYAAPMALPLHSSLRAQEVAPIAGPSCRPCARVGWSPDIRRIKRAAILAAVARERAAAAVRAAVAATLSPRRRGKPVRGRGKGMATARA